MLGGNPCGRLSHPPLAQSILLAQRGVHLLQAMFFDETCYPVLMGYTFRMALAVVLKKGFDPGGEGFFIMALHFMKLALAMEQGAAVGGGIETAGDGSSLVIVALRVAKLAQYAGNIAQAAQGSSLDLARFLLVGNGVGVFKVLFCFGVGCFCKGNGSQRIEDTGSVYAIAQVIEQGQRLIAVGARILIAVLFARDVGQAMQGPGFAAPGSLFVEQG